MKRRLIAKALMLSLATLPLAAGPASLANAQSVVKPSQDVVLSIGRGELISIPGSMTDVFIANEAIADVQVKSQRQLYVFGKAGGETTIYASNSAGDVIWAANVRVGSNIDSLDQMLSLAMPEAKIATATMGTNTVLLTGTVSSPEDVAEAERLVSAFLGDNANVISRLKMATPLQVNLQVRFAEVNRNFARVIGANLATFDSSSGFRGGVGNSTRTAIPQWNVGGEVFTGVTSGSDGTTVVSTIPTSGSTISGFTKFLGLDIGAAIDLAEDTGLLTTLSQPNLTALSGETAEFLAGGEYPYEQSAGLGTTAIQFKPYGISLAYAPVVLDNGRISMRVRSEVSELDFSANQLIPAITTRRAETTVELGSGQSFMIAGLMSNRAQNSVSKAPGLGDVPILGNLFRSSSFRRGETELVIIVTPYLVKPVNANDIVLPTDGYQSPNEVGRVLGYQQNGATYEAGRPKPSAVDRDGTPPDVSRIEPGAVLPTSPRQAESKADKKSSDSKRSERTAAATPGFSL
ncbi:type II and III secretion system protein family protein [Parerythrobacter aestuarii]|uniref:type II and III secretion system protein family protein n=1 Tax=Parerythrobacter aestuarii TaxID=3020909 RepID=UPI0024DEBAA2|nr:type II and III secretion system protein family protein [Parerythrobacter aestuarii]